MHGNVRTFVLYKRWRKKAEELCLHRDSQFVYVWFVLNRKDVFVDLQLDNYINILVPLYRV